MVHNHFAHPLSGIVESFLLGVINHKSNDRWNRDVSNIDAKELVSQQILAHCYFHKKTLIILKNLPSTEKNILQSIHSVNTCECFAV